MIHWMGKSVEECDRDELIKIINWMEHNDSRYLSLRESATTSDLRSQLRIKDDIIDRLIKGLKNG